MTYASNARNQADEHFSKELKSLQIVAQEIVGKTAVRVCTTEVARPIRVAASSFIVSNL